MSPAARGPCIRRTLDSMLLDHQRFMEESRGDVTKAKLFNNCIEYPFFNIPLSQTCNTVYADLTINMCIHLLCMYYI